MRRLTGYLVALLGLGFITLLFLWLWNLVPINWQLIGKLLLTLVLLAAAALLLAGVRALFFKDWSNFRPLGNRRDEAGSHPRS